MRVEIKLESFFLYNYAAMEFADKQNGKDMKPPIKIANWLEFPITMYYINILLSLWAKIAQH